MLLLLVLTLGLEPQDLAWKVDKTTTTPHSGHETLLKLNPCIFFFPL